MLEVPDGETLSLVGGGIEIVGGLLSAPNGRINLASAASVGEVTLKDTDFNFESFERLGNIHISQQGSVSTSGEGGGAIFIRGGEFVVDGSAIQADTLGGQNGVGIDVKTDSLTLTGGAQISASTFGAGKGGKLSAQIDTMFLSGTDASGFPSGLFATALQGSTGDAGSLTVKARSLEVRDGALIDVGTFGIGDAGNMSVTADNIFLSADEATGFAGIFAQSESENSGDAGDITITTGRLEMRGRTQISTSTSSASGRGGT